MSDWNQQVAEDVRKLLPKATADSVLWHHSTEFGRSIAITTPRYQFWLKKHDPHRSTPLAASVTQFQQRRREFHAAVADLLGQIGLYRIGTALFHELDSTPHTLDIIPYRLSFDGLNARSDPTNWQTSTRPGVPIDPTLHPSGPTGRGGGSNAVVSFSPGQWEESGRRGPGSRPDEILFHEIVHASRQMRGLAYGYPVSAGYDNEEEYISVVLTNIYLSHKRQSVFRANHQGWRPLPQPENFLRNPQNLSLPPEELIERFRHTTLPFYYEIMRIPDETVWFNPVRQYERARFRAMSWNPNASS